MSCVQKEAKSKNSSERTSREKETKVNQENGKRLGKSPQGANVSGFRCGAEWRTVQLLCHMHARSHTNTNLSVDNADLRIIRLFVLLGCNRRVTLVLFVFVEVSWSPVESFLGLWLYNKTTNLRARLVNILDFLVVVLNSCVFCASCLSLCVHQNTFLIH